MTKTKTWRVDGMWLAERDDCRGYGRTKDEAIADLYAYRQIVRSWACGYAGVSSEESP